MALIILVSPIWIAPLFNDFGPMKDKALETEILALAERASIEGSRVFEVDKSVDTKTVSAYVTGFAGTKRIVLWDTIIDRLENDELLFVMGHEMGHPSACASALSAGNTEQKSRELRRGIYNGLLFR